MQIKSTDWVAGLAGMHARHMLHFAKVACMSGSAPKLKYNLPALLATLGRLWTQLN